MSEQSRFAGADPSYFEHLQDRVEESDRVTREQRQQARAVFDRAMSEGSQKYGHEWLLWHMQVRDLMDADYLPKDQWGDMDVRLKAMFAEIALAILSEYKLVPREPQPEARKAVVPPSIQPATPNEAGAQQGIRPTFYGEGKSIDPNLGAMLIRQQVASRLLDAAVAAIELVTAQHKNVKIVLPAPMSATRLSFQAERFSPQLNGWEPLSGQEDFAHELRTCKNDTELILAIAKRIESEMELPPIIRDIDGK